MQKGQGALEYLILIGAAVFIAFIVLSIMLSSGPQMRCENAKNTWYGLCSAKMAKALCESTDIDGDGTADCQWDDTNKECTLITGD
ncbi:MAG: class III signal peptide-containing protein, partial [Candidatus Diapherotrites archaeon]|nr:class III signal peptide-containing protein [Candidatus Diapherotrites archaeon]